jgi:hypothetical protein
MPQIPVAAVHHHFGELAHMTSERCQLAEVEAAFRTAPPGQ